MKQVIFGLLLLCTIHGFLLPRELIRNEPYGIHPKVEKDISTILKIFKQQIQTRGVSTRGQGSIAGSFTPRAWLILNKAKLLNNLIH